MSPKSISVIIPMYNEERSAEKCVESLDGYLKDQFTDYEIICVNDGSGDSTPQVLTSLADRYPRMKPCGYATNRGKGCAVRTGIAASEGDIVLYTDCDLAYGTDIIGDMAEHLDRSGSDAVIGSRNLSKQGHSGYTAVRKLASKVYIRFLAIAAGFPYSDSQCGIKCYRGDTARRIFRQCRTDGFAFDLEALMIAHNSGMRITEHPATILNHTEDSSKVRILRDTFKMLGDISKIKKHVKEIKIK